jgi:hypothetical protein
MSEKVGTSKTQRGLVPAHPRMSAMVWDTKPSAAAANLLVEHAPSASPARTAPVKPEWQFLSPLISQPISQAISLGPTYGLAGIVMALMTLVVVIIMLRWK